MQPALAAEEVQVAIISGEASGDRAGAQLAKEIRRLRPDWRLFGAGGKYLREAGVELIEDSSRWGVVGVAQALGLLPRLLIARSHLHRELLRRRPSLLIPIDAGAFNLGFPLIEGLCPWVRRRLPETRILYYFPPGSWRRTLKRTTLSAVADVVATPFPWSESELRRHGVNAHFVGHPLLDLAQPALHPEEFMARYGIEREHPVVALLPGSRRAEIEHILPAQLAAAEVVRRRVPGVQFVVALASTVDKEAMLRQIDRYQAYLKVQRRLDAGREQVERRLKELEEVAGIPTGTVRLPVSAEGFSPTPAEDLAKRQKSWMERAAEMPEPPKGPLPIVLVEDAAYDVMAVADVLMVASGTATLEAAIMGKPMVILYKMSAWNRPQYWLVRKALPPYIGLPNLLAERRIVPEYVQDAATPEALASAVIDFLMEPDRMLKTREELAQVRALLGEPGGAGRAAQLAVDLVEGTKRERDGTGGGR